MGREEDRENCAAWAATCPPMMLLPELLLLRLMFVAVVDVRGIAWDGGPLDWSILRMKQSEVK